MQYCGGGTNLLLLLIHGIGANGMWWWNDFVSPLAARIIVYVPDSGLLRKLLHDEAHERFQAQRAVALMEAIDVKKMKAVGMSYGGFVAYSVAVQFGERVDEMALICARVCLEKDMNKMNRRRKGR
ncbi:hypothetical protein NL676_005958 [Syzygium grande]|nr:hypothetical protein NL676_005958 [Syzygium grande]